MARDKKKAAQGNQDVDFLTLELENSLAAARALVSRLREGAAGEAIANATLGLRHLEDAQHRFYCCGDALAADPDESEGAGS